ncbi:MAG: hypothetical protein ACI9UA_003546 [Pseudoalteromonas tetraodonis]|jgi:hypothetical protein
MPCQRLLVASFDFRVEVCTGAKLLVYCVSRVGVQRLMCVVSMSENQMGFKSIQAPSSRTAADADNDL